MFARVILSFVLIGVASTAFANTPKVYRGEEAQALRCAQLVFWVAAEGQRLGYISAADGHGIHAYGLALLDRYTTGTPRQKAAAVGKLSRSTDDAASLQKFLTQHRRCTQQFPI